jgi:hypothetical protein
MMILSSTFFYLYQPFLLGEDEGDTARVYGGDRIWASGHWWYKLAHVCQRWRNVILGSVSYLGLSLVCTNGSPVANMLAHSPHFPLVIDYNLRDFTAEDEEGAVLALKQRHRVRRVRLQIAVTSLQKLIAAMEEEYPILEYLILTLPIKDNDSVLTLPETLQAPHLRNLVLRGLSLPIDCRLLTTAAGLVALCLVMLHPSTYFHPNTLPRWLSSMPQLETLVIGFIVAFPSRDVERPLANTPIVTHVTLPNLHHLWFQGVTTYLEALVRRIAAPRLGKLQIRLRNQLTYSVPRLLQFMNTTENLRFDSAKFEFLKANLNAKFYSRREAGRYPFTISVGCWHFDWQVSFASQIFNSLGQMLSAVEHLILGHEEHNQSSEEHNEVERTEWRELLRSFSNVKTLSIDKGLVEEVSRCLELEDGELPLDLLPELQELTYSGSGDTGAFTSFVDARQNAGRPITVVGPSPSPGPIPSSSASITPANNEQ